MIFEHERGRYLRARVEKPGGLGATHQRLERKPLARVRENIRKMPNVLSLNT